MPSTLENQGKKTLVATQCSAELLCQPCESREGYGGVIGITQNTKRIRQLKINKSVVSVGLMNI